MRYLDEDNEPVAPAFQFSGMKRLASTNDKELPYAVIDERGKILATFRNLTDALPFAMLKSDDDPRRGPRDLPGQMVFEFAR